MSKVLLLLVTLAAGAASAALAPTAEITASALEGDGSLTVTFGCNCLAGDVPIAAYEWTFGFGFRSNEANPVIPFPPGRYHVELTVTDRAGLYTTARTEVVVTEAGKVPPYCVAFPSPPFGIAPITVTWASQVGAASSPILKQSWSFSTGEQSVAPSVTREYTDAGWFMATLMVEDTQGLRCIDVVRVVVHAPSTTGGSSEGVPPRIVSVANAAATCGTPYAYSDALVPVALGTGVPVWRLTNAPEGFQIDGTTGAMTWTPLPAQRGANSVRLEVETSAGIDHQHFDVEVACASEVALNTGCSAFAEGPAWAGLMLLLGLRRRKR